MKGCGAPAPSTHKVHALSQPCTRMHGLVKPDTLDGREARTTTHYCGEWRRLTGTLRHKAAAPAATTHIQPNPPKAAAKANPNTHAWRNALLCVQVDLEAETHSGETRPTRREQSREQAERKQTTNKQKRANHNEHTSTGTAASCACMLKLSLSTGRLLTAMSHAC